MKKKYYTHIKGKRVLFGASHDPNNTAFACLPSEIATARPMAHGKPMRLRHRFYPLEFEQSSQAPVVAKWTDGCGREHRHYVEAPRGRNFFLIGPKI